MTPSTGYSKYSIRQVRHTPSIASTHDCLSSHRSHDYVSNPECCICCWCTSLHDWQLSAISQWELKDRVTMSDSHSCEWCNSGIESQLLAHHPSTTSKYLSTVPQSWPPHGYPNLLNYGLQVGTLIAINCISPNSVDCGLQVDLEAPLIMASMFPLSWPPHEYLQTR